MIDESTNVVDSICLWDGDTSTWTPPPNTLMLIQANTQALVWKPVIVDNKVVDYVLVEELGVGAVGFTWNTTTQILTTNEPKPAIPA